MSDLSDLSPEEKMSHLRNLFFLAMKDGEVGEAETEVLEYCAEKYDIPHAQFEDLFENPDGVEFVTPTDENARFHQLFDLTSLMIIDGVINQVERHMFVHS